jgi:peptide/nickel transport system substrate-binding protein
MNTRRLPGRLIFLGAVLLSVAVAACGAPPDRDARPSVVRAGLYAEPQSLSLLGKHDRSSGIVARLVTDSLVQYDARLDLQPMLATSWEVSPDGRTVTFELRDGVRWHDGAPFTARDVVFSVEKSREPATEAKSFLTGFQDLVRVEALDDLTVRAEYSKSYADFMEAWTVPIIPEHLAGREPELLRSEFARHPVGCGPFRFVRHEPGQEIVFAANDDYWGGKPAIEGVTLQVIPDERTAYQALLRGDLHLVSVPPDIWAEAEASREADRLGRLLFYRLTVWYIAWNQDGSHEALTDPRVRRAMLLALDREPFAEKVLGGLGKAAATTYHPDSVWADPGIVPLPYDPQEASRLLDEAGWQDPDGDGIRERRGRPLELTLLTPASRQEISGRIAAWVQQSLAEIGVRMEIETLEFGAFLERRRSGQFDALMASLTFTPIPDQYELYHTSATEDGFNFFSFSDPEVDRLLELGRQSFDRAEREAVYRELQRRLEELQPMSCLFHFASPVLHDPRLRGLQPSPIDLWRITPGPRVWSWEESEPGP